MPQIVESLSFKQVTQVAIGQDFAIALGQDFDEYGQPIGQQPPEASQQLYQNQRLSQEQHEYPPRQQ